MSSQVEIIVAGHICLDIIPTIHEKKSGLDALLIPGKLVDIGPAVIATGGAVSNTGIALHRLGNRVSLKGKIGSDQFGEAILSILRSQAASLGDGMIVAQGESSSYTIVISPPHIDRIFLHATGANDTYSADDLQLEDLQGARLFHFGYPPLMRSMYVNEGAELARLLRKVKEAGLTVSMDLAKPDPESPAGQADWLAILTKALPYVDVFMPSFEEILFMLRRGLFEELLCQEPSGNLLRWASGELLAELSGQLLHMGAAVVGIKLGEYGLYLRTTTDSERLLRMGACTPEAGLLNQWLGCEMLTPCYEVEVVGTTGAGDCTIAGFLSGLVRGMTPEDALQAAIAVGACNVERADATGGIPPWDHVLARIAQGWAKRDSELSLEGWQQRCDGMWTGPHHQHLAKDV
ncbi:carbohydrate kinase family protein [Paenibacillus whitsoniae]|uniref:Carbohydrate kinase family protein n=1 Tax=Paenibacillus whitsoniae TaxID=2496558 RepID=A0A3S0AD76_9BACL|nr:carbohydrate kinase family protein [Paenibacillus whitsoniae]RTE10216.1 carbohydrate kinase family protein [Paenibacillus whitsoniae]